MKFSDLQCKEVICIRDGQRLGCISDVCIELPEGRITAVVVPGPWRLWPPGCGREPRIIPWSCVRQIGPDVVLVDGIPEGCRENRCRCRSR